MEATTLSREKREQILNAEIRKLSKQGFQLQYSTGTAAQMVKPKPPSTFIASTVLVILTFGLWLVVEFLKLLIQPVRKESTVYLEVLPDGTVETTTEGFLGGTSQDESHKVFQGTDEPQETLEPSAGEKPQKPVQKFPLTADRRLYIYENGIAVYNRRKKSNESYAEYADIASVDVHPVLLGINCWYEILTKDGESFAKSSIDVWRWQGRQIQRLLQP